MEAASSLHGSIVKDLHTDGIWMQRSEGGKGNSGEETGGEHSMTGRGNVWGKQGAEMEPSSYARSHPIFWAVQSSL